LGAGKYGYEASLKGSRKSSRGHESNSTEGGGSVVASQRALKGAKHIQLLSRDLTSTLHPLLPVKQEIETQKIDDLSIEKEYASVSKDKP